MNMKVDNNEKKRASIEVTEHPVFEGDMKTNIISSIDMSDIISSLFGPAFTDYYGCNVRINDGRDPIMSHKLPYGALYVDLYFKDQGESNGKAWKNIIARGSENDNRQDLGSRFQLVNGRGNGRVYTVTKQTYEALEEFMSMGNHTRWAEHTREIVTSMSMYGKEEVVVCISGLDLNKIITKIYGAKTEEGRYEYIATVSTMIPSQNQEFILQVCQLDLSAVRDLQRALGIYTSNAPQFHQYHR